MNKKPIYWYILFIFFSILALVWIVILIIDIINSSTRRLVPCILGIIGNTGLASVCLYKVKQMNK